ncbi:MAG TPA: hypothetical protein VIK01_28975 [Polyangiaceae bacterium]
MGETGTEQRKIERCSCQKELRRACDLCASAQYAFLACSIECLREHQLGKHGSSVPAEAEQRMRQAQREMNRRAPDAWDWYAPHRRRVMDELPRHSGTLCVFGAGNCADIDLEYLAKRFSEVHLVDLDGEAIERSRDRQSQAVRDRIVLHPNLDLSGFLDRLDAGPENFPQGAELGQSVLLAARGLIQSLGRTFDVTLSTCVLSQLALSYQEAWVVSEATSSSVVAATTALHLATLVGSTRSGGAGFMAFDVLSSDDLPALSDFRERPATELQAFVESAINQHEIALNPDPASLRAQLSSSGLGSLLASSRLTLPWLWNIKSAQQLVYGLGFERC